MRADRRGPVSEIADGLLILGMHRSGTSAVAGALDCLGVSFGEPLMPPREGENSRGYFEHMDFFEFHQSFLGRCAFAWDDPRRLDLGAIPSRVLDEATDELCALLRRHFSDVTTWAVKDPRVCRLLPLWHRALDELGAEVRHIIVLRHPDEVAASLAVRNGFSREKSDLLWADHLLEAEAETRNRRRAFIAYRDLLERPMECLTELAGELSMAWPRGGAGAQDAVLDFLDSGLRHHRVPERPSGVESRGRLGDLLPRLYGQLTAEANGHQEPDLRLFDELSAQLEARRSDLHSLMIEPSTQLSLRGVGELEELCLPWLEQQRKDIEELRDLVHELEHQLGERTRWLQIQDRILHDQVARIDRLERGEG